MDPRIGRLWLIATCLGIVMISCYISGVACDVPDDVVYTDEHKAVRIGDRVVLKCQFRGTPLAVYWKKGNDPERSPTLVSWITGDPATGSCQGERSCQIMEMNAEFSLITKEVSIAEQGLYLCRVANYKGILIHNFTDISVFSPPKEPYPIINECQIISPMDTETTCTISTSQSVELSCSASGYFPDIDLYFIHVSTRLYTKDPIEVTNLDGTKNKTLSAIATASENRYICFASVPGWQEQRMTTVLVTGPTIPIDKTDGSVAKVVVPVIIIIPLAVICIALIIQGHRWIRLGLQGGPSRLLESQTNPPSAESQTKPLSPELVKECATYFSTVSEMEFLKLARDIDPSYYYNVGISLGFSHAHLKANLIQNLKYFENAFMDVFMKWNVMQQPPHSNKRQLLADKLREIDLGGLSDRLLNEPIPNSTG